jgi:hypothetical protein
MTLRSLTFPAFSADVHGGAYLFVSGVMTSSNPRRVTNCAGEIGDDLSHLDQTSRRLSSSLLPMAKRATDPISKRS